MNSMEPIKTVPRLRKGYVVICVILGTVALCIFGITGYFRLSSGTAALQSSLVKSVGGQWHKKIAVRVGWVTMGLVRNGLRWVPLQAEPRALIEALHGFEVGVYNQIPGEMCPDRGAMLSATDQAMSRSGWTRAVGVAKEQEFVAVYIPRKGISAGSMKCRVIVLHGDTLVVASAQTNLKPLIEIAKQRLPQHEPALALR